MSLKCFISLFLLPSFAVAGGWFGIQVIDEATGDGVPLAELRTVNEMRFVSDNAGWVAVQEPGLMGREVFFHVTSPGYEIAKDGFGYRGVRLMPKEGGAATVKMKRQNIAVRTARLTGAALYRDSELLAKPVLSPNSADVLGQDSVQGVRYNGRLFFLWGDTNVAKYPLGNFHTTAATLPLDSHPSRGLAYEYFTSGTELRKMLPLEGPGAVWMFGLHTIRGDDGRDVLLSGFSQHPSLAERTRQGVARFDDAKGTFTVAADVGKDEPWRFPRGVAVQHDGYVYFASPFPHTRVPATVADVINPASYEAYSAKAKSWNRAHEPSAEPLISPDGKQVRLHTASVKWNAWRNCWILIGVQSGALGEVWYAESPAIDGPWGTAVKVASHPNYSFYNPVHHDFFDSENGRVIWFEGTYTREFSGNPVPTARYDYNQLMYRLDLADPRLAPAHSGTK